MSGQRRAGDPGEYAGPALPQFWRADVLGHFRASHQVFGWCSLERSIEEECMAWRLKHQRDTS